jgi:hypothetical protein
MMLGMIALMRSKNISGMQSCLAQRCLGLWCVTGGRPHADLLSHKCIHAALPKKKKKRPRRLKICCFVGHSLETTSLAN